MISIGFSSNTTWAGSRRRFGLILGCLLFLFATSEFSRAQEAAFNAKLTWKNGDKIPGNVLSADNSHLKWQTELFRDPLHLDLAYLDQIEFKPNPESSKTRQTYSVQTIDGFSLYGEVTHLDDRILTISSPRIGEVDVDRTQIATILNLKTSGSLINGEFDLDKWDANRNEKKYWAVNELGQLESRRSNIHLFMKAELPDSALIEVELEWKRKLDFTFGFGVPRNSRKIESLPRLESWDGSIVLVFNDDDDFEIVMESSEAESNRLKFLIHWNRKLNQMVIHNEQGKQLATANFGKQSPNIESGIYLENKSGDLQVTSLMIRRSAAGFNATEPSIQRLDQSAINGVVESFDGDNWVISTVEKDQDERISQSIPTDSFCGAFLINPAKQRIGGRTRLRFHDGMYVGGEFDFIQGDEISVKTDFSERSLTLKLADAANLRFDTPALKATSEKFGQRLYNNAGEIQGRLEKGTGATDDILRWRVPGARSAVPLSRGDARIVLQKKKEIVAVADQWADTLYLANRDTIPCRIASIDDKQITIESFTENKKIDQSLVKAIDLRNNAIDEKITPNDEAWVIPASSTKRVKATNAKMEVLKNAKFGHPWLFSSGGFEFDLAWKMNSYGVLECNTLVNTFGSAEGGKKINIMLYGNNLFVANPGEGNPNNGMIPVRNNKAKFAFRFQEGKIVVTVNGKKAYSEAVASSSNRGRGVEFRLNDLHQQNIKCTLSNFKLSFSESGNGIMVDPERKNLLLTIPRLKKKNPPKQILCANNTDMLRGELVSMDHQFVMFRANNEIKRFPRDIVSSIVWLHANDLNKKSAESVNPLTDPANDDPDRLAGGPALETVSIDKNSKGETDDSDQNIGQTAQILMQGGRRMTSTLESWTGDNLTGNSVAIGRCEIPMDQIYELRFGAFATKATDVPYSDWVAKMAPAPKMETGANGESRSGFAFGSASPLIGTAPKSFSAEMVDGKTFSLKSNLGKVVVLDFWATWCGPCVQALPKLERTIAQYSSDQIAFLAINQEEDIDQIKTFLDGRKLNVPVALDSGKIGTQFEVSSLPTTIIIDQDGNVAFVKVGNSIELEKKLKAAIDQLLADDDESKKREF